MEEHDLQAPARFQFRLRTLLFVVFLVSLYFSAVATLGNIVLGCGVGVPIGLVVGTIVGGACRRPWQGITGGVAGTFYVNVPLVLLATLRFPGDPEMTNPPPMFLIESFSISSLIGAIPGAIVGVRARRGIRASVNTGALAATGTGGILFLVEGLVEIAIAGPSSFQVSIADFFGILFTLFILVLILLMFGPPIGALFGALYWLFDESVRKRRGMRKPRSYASQTQSDLSADGHSPDKRHDSHE